MVAALLALFSSIAGGAADFVGGTQTRQVSALATIASSQCLGVALLIVWMAIERPSVGTDAFVPWAVLGGVTLLVGLGCFYQALATGTMSVVAPIAAVGVAVPFFWGLISGERPGAIQVVGVLGVVIGVVLASGPELRGQAGVRPIILAAVAGACFGSNMAFVAKAAQTDVLETMIVVKLTIIAPLLAYAFARRTIGGLAQARWQLVVLLSLLDTCAILFFALASRRGYISVVSVLASLYPVVTVLLARVVHRERLRSSQNAGVVMSLTGIVLIVAGSS